MQPRLSYNPAVVVGRQSWDGFAMNGSTTNGDLLLAASAEGWYEPRWYALKTRSRHEKRVRDQLLQRDIDTFLPLCETWRQWKDRKKKVELPLFPGYCFARFPLIERFRVLNVLGVADLVSINGRSEPVHEDELRAIQHLVSTKLHFDPHPFLEEGMDVEVIRGPLAGVRGKLLRKDRVTRLVLAVTLVRQSAVVEIHPADVVPV
ncbi:MAG: UpxY family transcription antiterminator [Chloroflexi bacterium]|nr:UpxY family transcription antiterminator [Chloroflexota bacterium]